MKVPQVFQFNFLVKNGVTNETRNYLTYMNCYFACVVNIQQIFYTVYVRLYSCSFYANLIKIRLVNPLLNNIEACIAYHRS